MNECTPQHTDKLELFCQEIQKMEGWYAGSKSMRNFNPGNLRCTPGQKANWNALAIGQFGGFCVFKDEATGMQALRNVTISCAKGLSVVYSAAARHFGLADSSKLNLYQYFVIRDPANDGNNPTALAERFGHVLGVDPKLFTMEELLS